MRFLIFFVPVNIKVCFFSDVWIPSGATLFQEYIRIFRLSLEVGQKAAVSERIDDMMRAPRMIVFQ